LDITLFPDKTILNPSEHIQVSGKVTFERTGFEVEGASVEVEFVGQAGNVTIITNELGRYLAEIEAPSKPGTYRLQVTVRKGIDLGDAFISISVADDTPINNGNGGEDETNWLFFVVALVIVLAVGMPLTYYFLLSKEAIRRRYRRVHEEIIEIVEEDKK
jgi:hypothetical protein